MSHSRGHRRVVITGMGAVTPLGLGLDSTWAAILQGKSGIRPIRQFGELTPPTHIAGQVSIDELPPLEPRTTGAEGETAPLSGLPLGRAAIFALHAAEQAWREARLDELPALGRSGGVSIGASTFPIIEDRLRHIAELLDGNRWNPTRYAELCKRQPWLLTQSDAAKIASELSVRYQLTGPSITAQAACASATQALGHAFQSIRNGETLLMLTGGTDSMLSMMCVTGFSLLGSLSRRWNEPERASRPFDRTRDGFVLAEGSAMLMLEELDHALKRGATIYAELVGYGSSCDAYRFTDMIPEGAGATMAMRSALEDAGIAIGRVGYINAHGTSTPLNDSTETAAIRRAFGPHADKLAVSSTKSQLGHLLCAAGAIELAVTALALRHGILPPTINLDYPDEACDLDYVPWKPRPADFSVAISNSFGFGGQNGCLVLRRWDSGSAGDRTTVPMPKAPRRVVITGLGVVSPLGLNVASHFAVAQASACLQPSPEAMAALGIPHACKVTGFDAAGQIGNRMLRKILTSAASYAVSAAGQALESAALDPMEVEAASLFVGSLGVDQDLDLFVEALKASCDSGIRFSYERYSRYGTALIDPLFLVRSLPNAGLCGAAIEHQIKGPNLNIMSGPASGLLALAAACQHIQSGAGAVALVGGYDSTLQLESVIVHLLEGRAATGAKSQSGYVLGEGAAFFVVEDAAHAEARKTKVYAEIAGLAHAHSAPADAPEALFRVALQASAGVAIDAVFGDGLNLPQEDALERQTLLRLGPELTLHTQTHRTGYCGVASPLFSLLDATLATAARAVARPLVWTSDHGRHHVAVALQAATSGDLAG
ncbi:MAG: beta-ketoacyl-ACP synthase II [Terracidiphilus sp.]